MEGSTRTIRRPSVRCRYGSGAIEGENLGRPASPRGRGPLLRRGRWEIALRGGRCEELEVFGTPIAEGESRFYQGRERLEGGVGKLRQAARGVIPEGVALAPLDDLQLEGGAGLLRGAGAGFLGSLSSEAMGRRLDRETRAGDEKEQDDEAERPSCGGTPGAKAQTVPCHDSFGIPIPFPRRDAALPPSIPNPSNNIYVHPGATVVPPGPLRRRDGARISWMVAGFPGTAAALGLVSPGRRP